MNCHHVILTGGGTGGHLFPGLAVADQLVEKLPGVRITFAGSGKPLERSHVAAAGFDYLALPCRPLPRRAREVFSFVVENMAGYLAARRFLAENDVAAVVGLGGFASTPMARAAGRRGVPLVLLEQNAVPGRATRWLARAASAVCVAFAKTRSVLDCRCPIHVTGNPIRREFALEFLLPRPWSVDTLGATAGLSSSAGDTVGQANRGTRQSGLVGALADFPQAGEGRLLILGGSGGARSLNESVPRAIYRLRQKLAGWQIVHQSGPSELEATERLYGKLGLPAVVTAFITDMPGMLGGSDLAVSRAGGTTLAEMSAAGLPAVLIPYPHATDDHQRHNADAYCRAGAAVTLDARDLSGRLDDHLAEILGELLDNPDRRRRMSAAMRRLARPQAASDVADIIVQVAAQRAGRFVPAAA